MAVPLPTGRPESSYGAFGKGIQTTVSWQKDIQTGVWATRQAGEITAPVVCLDLSLELLNCGRAANSCGIEGKLLLLVADRQRLGLWALISHISSYLLTYVHLLFMCQVGELYTEQ